MNFLTLNLQLYIPLIGKVSLLKKFKHWTMYEKKLHEHYYTLKYLRYIIHVLRRGDTVNMALLRYLKTTDGLPDLKGSL